LRHHYAIDLLFGSIYATGFFLLFRKLSLPRIDREQSELDLTNGWERLVYGWGRERPSKIPMSVGGHTRLRSNDVGWENGVGMGIGVERMDEKGSEDRKPLLNDRSPDMSDSGDGERDSITIEVRGTQGRKVGEESNWRMS
jgi:hypothetical protein